MAKSSRVTAAVILFGVLGIAVLMQVRSRRAHAESARPIAVSFTLETETYSFSQGKAQGELISRDLTARRADGTTATVSTLFPGQPHQRTIRVIRYLDGRELRLADAIAAKTDESWRRDGPRRPQLLVNPPAECVFAGWEKFIKKDTVLGHTVDVVRNGFADTEWRARDLGCQTIESRNGYKHGDEFLLGGETRAVVLKLGEPSPRLFDDGANYAELKPSDFLRREVAHAGIPWNEDLQREADQEERFYLLKP